jgi:hypothetical protein
MADLSLEADLDLLPTERGGRRGPVLSGYRPGLWFGETGLGGEPELHSTILRLIRDDQLAPGERGQVLLTPLAYEMWPQVRPGTRFDVYDAGRAVGTGILRTTPTRSAAQSELRAALHNAFEEWVFERFGELVARRPRLGKRLEPDLVAWFDDAGGATHLLVAEVVARKPGRRDVDRLARMMEHHSASLGLIVAFDEPSATTLDAIYRHGTVTLADDVRVPKIRLVTSRDLARNEIDLLPTKRLPQALELHAA